MSALHVEIIPVARWSDVMTPWADLVRLSDRATVFQSPEWVISAAHENIFAGDHFLAAVYSESDLIGIIPLTKRGDLGQVKRLLLLGGDYNDAVFHPDWEAPGVEAFARWLRSASTHCELADFRSLHPESVLLAHRDKFYSGRTSVQRIAHHSYPVIRLDRSWEEFRGGLSKSLREDLRYLPRRLARDHGTVVVRRAAPENVDADMATLFRLHQSRWQAKGEDGAFATEAVQRFHLSVARGFSGRGALALYTLAVEDKAIGSLYCLESRHETVFYLCGYDPEFAFFSPVKLLLARAIEDAISAGKSSFDFLKGEEDYKNRWQAQPRPTTRLLIGKRGFRPWFVMTGLSLQPQAKALSKRLRRAPVSS